MYIHEATAEAMKINGFISRETTATTGEVYAVAKQTNSYNACFMFVCRNGKMEFGGELWNPTVEDLIADDWEVLRDEFSNKVRQAV
ncbi:MAG: hypothetical protein Q4B89_00865 [Lachnospiraceae bacterium]|nr:hypothetical protein [Lachnospiraceae bacterium]